MRLQVGGALLLVGIGVFAAGCGTGVSGAAATFQSPTVPTTQPPGSPAAGQFGGAPWIPITGSRLSVRTSPTLLRSRVLVRADTFSKQQQQGLSKHQRQLLHLLGTLVAVVAHPAPGSRYTFECRVRGSRSLSGSQLIVELAAAPAKGPWEILNPLVRSRVHTGWQLYSLTRTVPSGRWKYLHAVVYARQSNPRKDWLALNGAIAEQDR